MTDNAAIYIADPSLIGSKFLNKFGAIKSYQGRQDGERATGLIVDLAASKITMNFMLPEEIQPHLGGFSGYVQTIGCADEDKLIYTLSRIRQVSFVIGCTIDPGFDEGGKTFDFLLDFAGGLNGLLFVHNSVIDYDGEVLAGPLRGE